LHKTEKKGNKQCEPYNYLSGWWWWWNTNYEASYPSLIRFLPAPQVANGDRCDCPTSVGVIAKEYLFFSRESWSFGKADYIYIYIYIYMYVCMYVSNR
jgi:hypothetical protein